eukprot:156485-Prorocentrum_minimum.AAC.4
MQRASFLDPWGWPARSVVGIYPRFLRLIGPSWEYNWWAAQPVARFVRGEQQKKIESTAVAMRF